ncbi:MAG: PASTA domain-containing protein [Holophagales bacterium]|nr:PASTA domain-containing protein [Holophagales bacterium]
MAAGLKVGRTFGVYSETGRSGMVVSQSPTAGARVEVEAPVDLFVSIENTVEVFVMPDLVNRDYEQVRAFFVDRGFRIGRVSYESYAGVDPGIILRQFPLAGHPLHKGDVISLAVVAPDHTDLPQIPGSSPPPSPRDPEEPRPGGSSAAGGLRH